jgi:hypothetical protein
VPATLTVTGTVGNAQGMTGAVFAGVTEFRVDVDDSMLYFKQDSAPERAISIALAITVTATKALNVWTLVIANT